MPLTPEQQQMVEDNIKLAYFALNKYKGGFAWVEQDDLMSTCFLGLTKAAKGYDPDKSKFSTYAMVTIYGTIVREFIPRKPIIKPVYLEEIVNSQEHAFWQEAIPDNRNFEDEIVCNMTIETLFEKVKNNGRLTALDKKIYAAHYGNPELNQVELSQVTGCSQVSVHRVYKKIREQFGDELAM